MSERGRTAGGRQTIPVPWTFMSEIFAKEGRRGENIVRFDSVSQPRDGHECPSYINRQDIPPRTRHTYDMY